MPSFSDIADIKSKRQESEDSLGKDIIDESRVQLMLKFRFLDLALWRMELTPLRVGARYPLATDAKQVYYDPPRVIARFQESFEESVRDYLHLIMHCIFRHPFDADHGNKEAWSLACDIIVENAIMDMCGDRFTSTDDVGRREAIATITMLVGRILPNKVYTLVKEMIQTPDGQQYRGIGRSTLNEWRDLFERCDHGAWPAFNNSKNQESSPDQDITEEMTEDDENPDVETDAIRTETLEDGASDESGSSSDMNSEESCDDFETDDEDACAPDGEEMSDDSSDDDEERNEPQDFDEDTEREKKEWEDISKQIEMNLETFSKEWGSEAGSLIANLAHANRKNISYTDFLRKFMVVTEDMLLNMDEFDYIYYTYGLDLYGNMPLVEPLEYKETNQIREFAIAIDTSESVSEKLVKRFIEYTFSILKESQDFASDVNIHIIQCDARVQSDIKVKDLKDIDKLMSGLQIRGFGGTDFRPVFDYIDMLRKRGELTDLKGLIYFTDGLGQFPEKMPDYDAAFVFVDEEGVTLPPVPPWAMKVLIDEAGIKRLKTKAKTKSDHH